jgi:HTH-type transcriptional regulator/antitoxin MqsA
MKCPVCGGAELIRDIRDLPHSYKGEATVIPSVVGDWCPACGECILDAADGARVSAAMLEFKKHVIAATVDPRFITAIRKKLQLDQREAGELFGGGVNAFSRYETGKTRPPIALVRLLNLLDRHPGLLAEIRADHREAEASGPSAH